ncbi:MAG: esterase family protein [Bryobacteraceae bacterium]|nr:esterase family protein [Bryobacteraceae bacterium]MDW8376549.1 alpha/beta hydrolase-fold protein [Bryobacterales bacterium]
MILLSPVSAQPYKDQIHASRVLGSLRTYRVFLPSNYETSGKAYPVIYYFHSHSDRYTLGHFGREADFTPRIADYVASHDVIVVVLDGYVARDYTGFYGGSPWDLREDGGTYDFGAYFLELSELIDSHYRTLKTRRWRATSGLSMGGFMSLYLSARYPERIGSASAFNPSPEAYAGEPDNRNLWRSKDHLANHAHSKIRLVRASGDYISQYHEETRAAYARAHDVDFEFRQDEYHRHWATSIAETFDFHMRAFSDEKLDRIPERWSYTSAYRNGEPWGYRVSATGKGFWRLEDVTASGFRSSTRKWAPDGPPDPSRRLQIWTTPQYQPGASYALAMLDVATGRVSHSSIQADESGRLRLELTGAVTQVSLAGPGLDIPKLVVLPVTSKEVLRVLPGGEQRLPVRIYNPRATPVKNVSCRLESEYPTVEITVATAQIEEIPAFSVSSGCGQLSARFISGDGDYAHARLSLAVVEGKVEQTHNLDVAIAPSVRPAPLAIEVLDGRTVSFPVFRQKGNQGGGASIQRTVTEGRGNGNGRWEPGEEVTIWVKLAQGLDPFDRGNWYRAKVFAHSPWIEEVADLQEQKQLEWTGAKERTSLVRLLPGAPAGAEIPIILRHESWSFHFTPDVRYGREPLYQAFQLHRYHVYEWKLRVPDQGAAKSPDQKTKQTPNASLSTSRTLE